MSGIQNEKSRGWGESHPMTGREKNKKRKNQAKRFVKSRAKKRGFEQKPRTPPSNFNVEIPEQIEPSRKNCIKETAGSN